MKLGDLVIGLDFDGTCVLHEYPLVGQELPRCVPTLMRAQEEGAKIILYTMRSGQQLKDAIDWFSERGIHLWGINENPDQKKWTTSPKVYAHVYIDDAALGCPLVWSNGHDRPFVDWIQVSKMLFNE